MPSLQLGFNIVEEQLNKFELFLNADKCCCLRVRQRFAKHCGYIVPASGALIRWSSSMRYLGIWVIASRSFKCDFSRARVFCRAANSVLSKVVAMASEEVVIHLIRTKCIPILLYGVEATGLISREAASIDFSL